MGEQAFAFWRGKTQPFQRPWWFSDDIYEHECIKILFIMLVLVYIFIFLRVAVQSSHYVTISRTSFKGCQLVTLKPPIGQSRPTKSHIREIIYVPSHINVQPEELQDHDVLHDDHFCSLLCDQGFIVHVMRLNSPIGMSTVVNLTSISQPPLHLFFHDLCYTMVCL